VSDTNILVFDNAGNGKLLIMEYCLSGKVTFDDFQHFWFFRERKQRKFTFQGAQKEEYAFGFYKDQ